MIRSFKANQSNGSKTSKLAHNGNFNSTKTVQRKSPRKINGKECNQEVQCESTKIFPRKNVESQMINSDISRDATLDDVAHDDVPEDDVPEDDVARNDDDNAKLAFANDDVGENHTFDDVAVNNCIADDGVAATRSTNDQARRRGPNKLANLTNEDKKNVRVNDKGQPVGIQARKYSSFLGTLARDPRLLPIDALDWRELVKGDKKEELSGIAQMEYNFNGPAPKRWTLTKINHCWRNWKNKLKEKWYKPTTKTMEEILECPDKRVDLEQWRNLVEFWNSDDGMARSDRNAKNRANLNLNHACGTKSMARLRDELTIEGEEPNRLEVFQKAYGKTKPNREASTKLKEIEERLTQIPEGSDISMERDAIFNEVIGGDKRGYKRTFGIGVNSCVGVPKQISNGALKLIQEEKGKRQALEDAMAVEVQKRMDLENEIEHETNKRKEIEEQMADEKKRRIALEDDVHILKGLLFELQPSLKKKIGLFSNH